MEDLGIVKTSIWNLHPLQVIRDKVWAESCECLITPASSSSESGGGSMRGRFPRRVYPMHPSASHYWGEQLSNNEQQLLHEKRPHRHRVSLRYDWLWWGWSNNGDQKRNWKLLNNVFIHRIFHHHEHHRTGQFWTTWCQTVSNHREWTIVKELVRKSLDGWKFLKSERTSQVIWSRSSRCSHIAALSSSGGNVPTWLI